MGPTERSIPTILDKMHEGDYSPKLGKPIPMEKVYEANTITYDQYRAILQEWEEERRNYARAKVANDMGAESDMLADRMRKAGVPNAYATCSVDLTHVQSLNGGRWLYIHGQNVEPVMQRACASMKGWISKNTFGTARFERVTSLLSEFRDIGTETDAMARYAGYGLLVIAGLGVEPATDWALAKLWELFDRRASGLQPTIIATRHGPQSLAEHLGGRGNDAATRDVMDVIRRMSVLIDT